MISPVFLLGLRCLVWVEAIIELLCCRFEGKELSFDVNSLVFIDTVSWEKNNGNNSIFITAKKSSRNKETYSWKVESKVNELMIYLQVVS